MSTTRFNMKDNYLFKSKRNCLNLSHTSNYHRQFRDNIYLFLYSVGITNYSYELCLLNCRMVSIVPKDLNRQLTV